MISGDHFVRNYLTTDAFEDLEKTFSCYYVGCAEITLRERLEAKSGFLGYYRYDPDVSRRHMELFDVLMWGMRHKSSSFRFRAMRTMTKEPIVYQKRHDVGASYNVLRYFRHLSRRLHAWPKKVRYDVITSRLVLPSFVRITTQRIRPIPSFSMSSARSSRGLSSFHPPHMTPRATTSHEYAPDCASRACSWSTTGTIFRASRSCGQSQATWGFGESKAWSTP